MPRKKIRALIILLVLAASVPVLRFLDREFFQPDYLGYTRQGIGFVIDRQGLVEEIHIYPVEGLEGEDWENSEGNTLIYPGRGVGNIHFGDLEGEIRKKWPAEWEGYGRKAAHIIYSRKEGVNFVFQEDELVHISLTQTKYRTESGIGVGSRKEEAVAAYEESYESPRVVVVNSEYRIIRILGFAVAARLIEQYLVLAGILSIFSLWIIKDRNNNRRLWLMLVGYLALFIINLHPLQVFKFGFDGIILSLSSPQYLIFYFVLALPAPLILAGIWRGEKISAQKRLEGARKYLFPGLWALAFSAGYYILLSLGVAVFQEMKLGSKAMLETTLLRIPLSAGALVFYLAFLQFNRLFGDDSGYLVYRSREI